MRRGFITILVLSIVLGHIFISNYRANYLLKDEYQLNEKTELSNAVKEYNFNICDKKFNEKEYAFISLQHYIYPDRDINDKSLNIDFYSLNRSNILSTKWSIEYLGGANIRNTTFDELVTMVKKDCDQFKKPFGERYDETINWSYSEYRPELYEKEKEPEPNLTEEEQKEWDEFQQQLKEERDRNRTNNRVEYTIIEE